MFAFAVLILKPPNQEKKVLLHSCCAPCAGEVMESIVHSGLDLKVFFYNPNIQPKEEYEIRKNENKRFCDKLQIFLQVVKKEDRQ